MYAPQQPKKMMILNVLDILRNHSDENHRLSQKNIVDILASEYGMKADRKAVKRNLMSLAECGYPLEYTEIKRLGSEGGEASICTDWYLVRDFTDAELRLLIDSLLFASHIPHKQCAELVKKLKSLAGVGFSDRVRHIYSVHENVNANKQLFYTIDRLDEALETRRQVVFEYACYDVDRTLHTKTDRNGQTVKYTVNPFQMAATNGRYYLICNVVPHSDITYFRLDRIKNISVSENPAAPVNAFADGGRGLDLGDYMAEHLYMHSGKSVPVTLSVKRRNVDTLFDWFDASMTFTNINDDTVDVHVKANRNAVKYWAIQFCLLAEVLEPADLRQEVAEALKEGCAKYSPERIL